MPIHYIELSSKRTCNGTGGTATVTDATYAQDDKTNATFPLLKSG
jgi:hypothetical protein